MLRGDPLCRGPWKAALDPETRKLVEDFAKETHALLTLPPRAPTSPASQRTRKVGTGQVSS